MKRTLSLILAAILILSLAACAAPAAGAQPAFAHAAGELCTEEDTLAVRDKASAVAGLQEAAKYLTVHQGDIPATERACIDEILAGSDFSSLDGTEYTNGIDMRYPDVIMGVLFIHGTQIDPKWKLDGQPQAAEAAEPAPGEPLTAEELAAKLEANAEYFVDASAYPTPEDGADFLPYFKTFKPEVLDEALGVTLSTPREISDTTTCIYGSVARAALFTNTSDKTVQLIPANDLPESKWKKVEGYDPSLIIDWASAPGTKNAATDLIPLSCANILEPGESTVMRFTYIGHEGEDLTFQSRFSVYVTDGKTTELLAATSLNHVLPSKYNPGSCTISGTVYDEETGIPLPNINVQASRNGHDFAMTDSNGRFTLTVPAIKFDSTGNWARASVFANEMSLMGEAGANDGVVVDPAYAQSCMIVEPRDGKSIELTFALKKKPAQVNYTLQTEHDMYMQAYCVDSAADIIATAPFHTTFSEEYKYENGYLHVFDKTGTLLFEKRLYGESAFCDVSADGKLVASVVHGKKEGDPDTAVIWDIKGNEVFSYQVPYKENPKLYVQPQAPGAGVFSKLGDLEISNDGKMLLIATDEGYVCVVRLSDKKIICDFFGNGKMYKLFWSADDKVVYTGTESGNFRATEAATGKLLWQKYIEATIFGWAMTDDTVITSTKATGTGYLICTELATGKTRWTLDVGMRNASMCLSHDKKTLFWGTDTSTTNERCVFIDTETGTPLWGTRAGKQAGAFSADDRYVALRSGGNLTLWTRTGEHLYGALIAKDDNSMSWGLYMSGDCKNIVSFAGGSTEDRHYGVMYALTLDENTPLP